MAHLVIEFLEPVTGFHCLPFDNEWVDASVYFRHRVPQHTETFGEIEWTIVDFVSKILPNLFLNFALLMVLTHILRLGKHSVFLALLINIFILTFIILIILAISYSNPDEFN